MRKSSRIAGITIVLLIITFLIVYLMSPIMIASEGIITREKVAKFEDLYDINAAKRFTLKDERQLVLINLSFKDDVKIYLRSVGSKGKERKAVFKKKGPFIWTEKIGKTMSNIYEVEINEDEKYFFIYLAP